MAKLSGAGPLRIIFLEIAPNLLPFLVSSFVTAVSAAILAEHRARGDGAGPSERTDARHDDLLDHGVLGVPARACGGGSCPRSRS